MLSYCGKAVEVRLTLRYPICYNDIEFQENNGILNGKWYLPKRLESAISNYVTPTDSLFYSFIVYSFNI